MPTWKMFTVWSFQAFQGFSACNSSQLLGFACLALNYNYNGCTASGTCIFQGPLGFPHFLDEADGNLGPPCSCTWGLRVSAGPESDGNISKLSLILPKRFPKLYKSCWNQSSIISRQHIWPFFYKMYKTQIKSYNLPVHTSACLQTHLSWCRGSFPEQSLWNPHLDCFHQILFHSLWVCGHLESALMTDFGIIYKTYQKTTSILVEQHVQLYICTYVPA